MDFLVHVRRLGLDLALVDGVPHMVEVVLRADAQVLGLAHHRRVHEGAELQMVQDVVYESGHRERRLGQMDAWCHQGDVDLLSVVEQLPTLRDALDVERIVRVVARVAKR